MKLLTLGCYFALLLVAGGVASAISAPRDGTPQSLADRVAALEKRIAEVERQCGCRCAPVKSAATTQPAKKRMVWHPPRISRDEDENLPGYWEEVE